MHRLLIRLLALSLTVTAPAYVTAQQADAELVSAAEVAAAVAEPTDTAVAKKMNGDTRTVIWSIKRDAGGEVELHRAWNDVIIAREGSCTVLLGEKVEGNRQIKPTEWYGGTIIGGHEIIMRPGDVLFIPAGLGHQMTPIGHKPFTYLVVKTEAHTPAGS